MKKILIINNEMSIGGTEKVLLTLLKFIDKKSFDITLLIPAPGDVWEKQIPEYVNIKYIFKKNPRDFKYINKLLYSMFIGITPGILIQKIFIKEKFDSYISFKQAMVMYLKGAKGRKLCWIHGTYCKSDYKSNCKIKQIWKKHLYNMELKQFSKCDSIVCVSNASRDAFLNTFNINPSKVITLYNPNDTEKIKKLSKEKIEIKFKNRITICAVGRMDPVKAFHRLINICYKLTKEGIEYNLIMVGDGEEYNKIQSLIKKFNLEENIYLVGYQENPYKYIAKSDIFVCSSISEAFSTVATEAIILGKPVVTTLCSGMEELLNPRNCGIITENSEEGLYEGIKCIIKDKALLDNLTISAKERSNDFNTIDLIKKIEDIFISE
ncbi:glycosyl transferase [[Clostridium] sordellii]|uniref:glycosyltransferase n=1 Tax=Paraclostridium sordellii TaxID=1505 RepID=UPI0005E49B3F|nr:glycosyltransferase [Paeniclostridium sordellii]CEN91720.1 glycosyl transferase [[Clostridium] sordellii] [Paeniclostridium sordellii]CEP49333.1 glycosyl transferase [[Clostridium] sordellii] [Paeniclostridium sordellii]